MQRPVRVPLEEKLPRQLAPYLWPRSATSVPTISKRPRTNATTGDVVGKTHSAEHPTKFHCAQMLKSRCRAQPPDTRRTGQQTHKRFGQQLCG
jgi:hypothetical protein